MHHALALALTVLSLGSALAAPGPDDVAWFADLLGVSSPDLPATLPGTQGTFGSHGLALREVQHPIEVVAAWARESFAADGGEETVFLGAGVRGVTGTGASWTGSGVGPASTFPCLQFTVAQPLGPTPAGDARLGIHAEVPEGASIAAAGTARMDAAAFPPLATAVPTLEADGLLQAGTLSTTCGVFFNLRFTSGTFRGDGTVSRLEP